MKYITIFLYFLLILFIQIDQQQGNPMYPSFTDELQDYPSLRLNTMDDIDDKQQHHSIDQFWDRIVNNLSMLQRQRRFGNTRYGRSLPDE
jgi:hypothetical protein